MDEYYRKILEAVNLQLPFSIMVNDILGYSYKREGNIYRVVDDHHSVRNAKSKTVYDAPWISKKTEKFISSWFLFRFSEYRRYTPINFYIGEKYGYEYLENKHPDKYKIFYKALDDLAEFVKNLGDVDFEELKKKKKEFESVELSPEERHYFLASELSEYRDVSGTYKAVRGYLNKSRGIPYSVIDKLISDKFLYQISDPKGYPEAAFVGRYDDGRIACVMHKSCIPNSDFRGDWKKCDYSIGWRYSSVENEYDVLYCFEAPIDMMSFISIMEYNNGDDWKKHGYIAQGGAGKFKSTIKMLEDGNYKKLVICYDNDETGLEEANKLKEQVKSLVDVEICIPQASFTVNDIELKCKDWNDALCLFNSYGIKDFFTPIDELQFMLMLNGQYDMDELPDISDISDNNKNPEHVEKEYKDDVAEEHVDGYSEQATIEHKEVDSGQAEYENKEDDSQKLFKLPVNRDRVKGAYSMSDDLSSSGKSARAYQVYFPDNTDLAGWYFYAYNRSFLGDSNKPVVYLDEEDASMMLCWLEMPYKGTTRIHCFKSDTDFRANEIKNEDVFNVFNDSIKKSAEQNQSLTFFHFCVLNNNKIYEMYYDNLNYAREDHDICISHFVTTPLRKIVTNNITEKEIYNYYVMVTNDNISQLDEILGRQM